MTNHELLEHYNANDARYTATKFLKEDFGNMGPSAIADFRTLSQLKVGDISPAYQTQDMNGNQLSKIVKLVQIIPTHVASLNEDYLRLEQMALNRKQEKVLGSGSPRRSTACTSTSIPSSATGSSPTNIG